MHDQIVQAASFFYAGGSVLKEPLINSEVPFGIGIYQHFSNRQLFEKWSKVKVASFTLRALKSPGWTYSELP
jgi:hypothetical protein